MCNRQSLSYIIVIFILQFSVNTFNEIAAGILSYDFFKCFNSQWTNTVAKCIKCVGAQKKLKITNDIKKVHNYCNFNTVKNTKLLMLKCTIKFVYKKNNK